MMKKYISILLVILATLAACSEDELSKLLGQRSEIKNGVLTIHKSPTVIKANQYKNKGITKVNFHDGITEIGSNAFAENKIERVELPKSLTNIGKKPFAGNPITKVMMPMKVLSVLQSDGLKSFPLAVEYSFAEDKDTSHSTKDIQKILDKVKVKVALVAEQQAKNTDSEKVMEYSDIVRQVVASMTSKPSQPVNEMKEGVSPKIVEENKEAEDSSIVHLSNYGKALYYLKKAKSLFDKGDIEGYIDFQGKAV